MLNKKMLLSILMIGMVATVAGAGTWACFSDVETSEGNTVQTGTIDLKLNGADMNGGEDSAVVTIDDIKPGWDLVRDKTLMVTNNDARVWMKLTDFDCADITTTDAELEDTIIDDDISKVIYYDLWLEWENANGVTKKRIIYDPFVDMSTYVGIPGLPDYCNPQGNPTLSELNDQKIYLGKLKAGVEYTVHQSFHMQKCVGNWAQGDMCTFTEEFTAKQISVPPEDAMFPTDFIEIENEEY